MRELPDVTVYVECLVRRVTGQVLEEVRVADRSLLRTVTPPPRAAVGRRVRCVRRLVKRVVIGFEGGLFFVIRLRVAGRLRWRKRGAKLPRRAALEAWEERRERYSPSGPSEPSPATSTRSSPSKGGR